MLLFIQTFCLESGVSAHDPLILYAEKKNITDFFQSLMPESLKPFPVSNNPLEVILQEHSTFHEGLLFIAFPPITLLSPIERYECLLEADQRKLVTHPCPEGLLMLYSRHLHFPVLFAEPLLAAIHFLFFCFQAVKKLYTV